MSHFSVAAPVSVIVAGLAIWLGAGWLCLANWRRSGNRGAAWKLETLRFILVTLLVLTLLRPEYVEHLQRAATPEIAILVDGSDSMKTRDLVVSNNVLSRAQWIGRQMQSGFWTPWQNKAKVTVETFAAPSTNQDAINGTDLGQALDDTFHRFKNLKAVLLLSDGDWNMGQSPLAAATRYREQNIPVFTVAVGRETPCRTWRWKMFPPRPTGFLARKSPFPSKSRAICPAKSKPPSPSRTKTAWWPQNQSSSRPTARWRNPFSGRRARRAR
jgi:hypothetical protein